MRKIVYLTKINFGKYALFWSFMCYDLRKSTIAGVLNDTEWNQSAAEFAECRHIERITSVHLAVWTSSMLEGKVR